MSNQFTDPRATDPAASIVLSAATPARLSKEQLAAAERARLYHVNKLAAYRATTTSEVDPPSRPAGPESAVDASGAH